MLLLVPGIPNWIGKARCGPVEGASCIASNGASRFGVVGVGGANTGPVGRGGAGEVVRGPAARVRWCGGPVVRVAGGAG